MRIVYLGCTKFSEEILLHLLDQEVEIVGIFTIPEYFKINYSPELVKNTNYADLSKYAQKMNVPHFEVNSFSGHRMSDYHNELKKLKPDVILTMGWYYMVDKKTRSFAKYGAWGIHASLLPNYAGGAPLVWAIIEGAKETGVTLFKLDDSVDGGDIIGQVKFEIDEDDTIKDVYSKATEASKEILSRTLLSDNISFKPQDKSRIKVYPQRSPKDGEIDWNWEPEKIKNFIRAQSKPYPGAWTKINGKKVTIWDAKIDFDDSTHN